MMSIASPLLAIPAITSHFGAAGWSAVAIGQSMGASLAVIVELGWGLTGPQRVAKQSAKVREQTLAVAMITKLIVLLPLIIVASLFSFVLSTDFQWESAAVAAGATTYGLNNNWYYIGTGSSSKILLSDAIPRLLCVGGCAVAILLGGPLFLYPLIAVLLPSLIGVLLTVRMESLSTNHLRGMTSRRIVHIFKCQGTALGGRALSAMYMSLPVTVVSMVSPQTVAVFSAIERLQRIGLQILSAVPNMMQNWVGEPSNALEKRHRAIRAIYYNAAFGFVSGLTFTLLIPTVAHIVFAGKIEVPTQFAAISGVLIFVICTSRASGSIALVALNSVKHVMVSAAAGAAVGIPSILLGAKFLGTIGALSGEVLAELVVLIIQIIAIKTKTAGEK
jgi:O-antigen/teichoic acid export membrane protein